MISADEALRLPTAKLSRQEQTEIADALEKIDAFVRLNMKRAGCDMMVFQKNTNVMSEVSRALCERGWAPRFEPIAEQSKIQGGQPKIIGFRLVLEPSNETYKAVGHLVSEDEN